MHIPESTLEEYAMRRHSRYRAQRVEEHLDCCPTCRERLAVENAINTGMKAAAKLGVHGRAKRLSHKPDSAGR